jgi:hypothetical protein
MHQGVGIGEMLQISHCSYIDPQRLPGWQPVESLCSEKMRVGLEQWFTHVIPAPGRQRLEDGEFEASLGYVVRCYLQKKKNRYIYIYIHIYIYIYINKYIN